MTALRAPARFALTAVVSISAIAVLSGCSVLENIFPAQAERDDETQEISEGGQQDVFEVAVGDCFNDEGDSSEISDLPAVPCTEPHDNEIYYLFDLPGDEFPADIDAQSDAGCLAQFAAFIGVEYDVSTQIDYFPIQPTAETWEAGDREVICSVYDIAAQTTGTLAGAAR
ncbi:hypothetical protein HD599_002784 [Conyzicola lurida]|uniref:Septum formation-related domain-containing protein n=1 Tax=Conyzicola lurida TaxID=1172621 RepID=A0A841ARR2_9MICO|nr:septum formation family protein [Conyzicola lurida]MBB5844461.1 hypothetical protein [Conyzicola lurida]